MSLEELSSCIIVSAQDVERLDIDLSKLLNKGEHQTPFRAGIRMNKVNQSLQDYIQKIARKKNADLAVVHGQSDLYGIIPERCYDFTLYQFK